MVFLNFSGKSRLCEKYMHKLRGDELVWEMEAQLSEFSVFDLHQILDATGDFSDENKLGEGGFGPVYKVQKALYMSVKIYSRNTFLRY